MQRPPVASSHSPRRRLVVGLLPLALALGGLMMPGLASADGTSPDTSRPAQSADAANPVGLTGAAQSLSLTSFGTANYAYYAFDYDGTGQTATINLQVDKAALDTNQVGFRVYGPQTGTVYATGGIQGGVVPNISADMRSSARGRYLVQVFDSDRRGITFAGWIWGSGTGFHAVLDASAASNAGSSGP